MSNEGLGQFDMTSRWDGFYRHRAEQLGAFPITAEIHQSGDRITGEMYDQITDRSHLLDSIVEVHRDDMSPGYRLRLGRMIHQFGDGIVVVDSRLSETSDIDGRLIDCRLTFTKSHRGAFQVRWRAGGKELGSVRRTDHKVEYAGLLDREKGFVLGEWIIRTRGWLGRVLPPEGLDSFDLYRKS